MPWLEAIVQNHGLIIDPTVLRPKRVAMVLALLDRAHSTSTRIYCPVSLMRVLTEMVRSPSTFVERREGRHRSDSDPDLKLSKIAFDGVEATGVYEWAGGWSGSTLDFELLISGLRKLLRRNIVVFENRGEDKLELLRRVRDFMIREEAIWITFSSRTMTMLENNFKDITVRVGSTIFENVAPLYSRIRGTKAFFISSLPGAIWHVQKVAAAVAHHPFFVDQLEHVLVVFDP